MESIRIDRKFQGPRGYANGGYVAGMLGKRLGGEGSSVRLHRPVPLDTALEIVTNVDGVELRQGVDTIATGWHEHKAIPTATFVPIDEAISARTPELTADLFDGCFVCAQPSPDGLGVEPKQLDDGRFVAIWEPGRSRHIRGEVVSDQFLRAALDCPGGYAALTANRTLAVTGSLASEVRWLPHSDSRLIVVGESTYAEGRKLGATTTVFTADGEVVATGSAVWIALAVAL